MSTTRTSLVVDSELWSAAKTYAADHKLTLRVLIEDALRSHLETPIPEINAPVLWPLPTFDSGALLPGISPDSNTDLLAKLDEAKQDEQDGE